VSWWSAFAEGAQDLGGSDRVFFLQAILFHDPFHTPSADGEASLAEFLSNDVDRGIGIEEAVTNYLSFDLISPDRVGLGPAFLVLEAQGSLVLKSFVQLIISLS